MSAILIRGATILTMDAIRGADPPVADMLIEGERITRISTGIHHPTAEVIDGRDRAVIPGLVNAHIHSAQNFFRGRYDSLPLELLMLYAYPMVNAIPLPPHLIYLRTLLVGMESLKTGVTTILDDVLEVPGQSLDQLDAVFRAYDDLGLRACCSGHIINKSFTDTIPYAYDVFPPELVKQLTEVPPPTTDSYLEFSQEAISRFHGRSGRLRYAIAPSGPQRCTDDLLMACAELAREKDTTYHIHVLETKSQAVTGRELYGKTLVRHMHDIGALEERTTLAHAIWVTEEDIELMADAQCSVAHNPICNMRIGAGVAPLRRILDAGVNVGLGTDGISSNDTSRVFDVMHVTGLVHNVTSPDYRTWPTAEEVLLAATIGGARSLFLHEETGSLEPGKKADLSIVDLTTLNFTPRNDLRKHLVFCENGSSVEVVIVNGEIVMRNGKVQRIDEGAALEEIRGHMPEFLQQHSRVEELNREFEPHLAEIHRRCSEADLGLNRYSSTNGCR